MSTVTLPPSLSRPVRSSSRGARPGGAPAEAAVRLTRRGRLAVLALALLVALGLGLALAAGSVATAEPGAPTPTRVVTVAPGDTLWDLAAEAAAATGSSDVRGMVSRIQDLNGLESGALAAGDQVRVPLAGD